MEPDAFETARKAWSFYSDTEKAERHLQKNFSSIGDVHAFHNHLVTGTATQHYLEYFHARHIGDLRSIDAVSLGCGNGHLERTLLGFGWRLSTLLGLELNPNLVEYAQSEVAKLPQGRAVTYRVADLNRLSLEPSSVDLAVFFHSLHHVESLETCLAEVTRALRVGGTLLVVDYFGGNRLQRSDEHLALCDLFLRRIPEVYRIDLSRSSGSEVVVKERCENVPVEQVIQFDPSEAVRSEEIEAALRGIRQLVVAEEKPTGGTILDPLLMNIAGNFRPEDQTAMAHVHMAMSGEEALLRSHAIRSDYRFMVLKKR